MSRTGELIIATTLALLCVGVVMVASAGMSVGQTDPVTLRSIAFSRPAAYAAGAFALLLIVSRLPVRSFARQGLPQLSLALLWPLSVIAVMLVYVPGIGKTVNGARRWVEVPGVPFGFQPSEIAKWAMVGFIAWYAVRSGTRLKRFTSGLLPALGLLGIVAGLVTIEDLGTGVLIGCAGVLVLIAAGAKVWHFAAVAPVGLAGLAIALYNEPYRLRRLEAFTDPFADPQGTGYHIIQSLVAIANGEGFGRGLGFGLQKFGYLPEDRTDFLFAIICEELGIAGAASVLALYGVLLCAGLAIIARQRTRLLQLAGLGILATLGGQALMNLVVVTGLAPTKGIALPLLSAGGTGWLITASCLGVLVAMDREATSEERFAAIVDGVASPAAQPLASDTPSPAQGSPHPAEAGTAPTPEPAPEVPAGRPSPA